MSDTIVQLLTIETLQPNPFQPRGKIYKEELEELAQSIKSHGILEPLVVAHTPAGYQIIAGERRWRAAKLAGMSEVPVIVRETTPKGMLEMALIENVQRINLNAIERAKAFDQLLREFGYSTTQLATTIGKSKPYVSNTVKLLHLPDAITDGVVSGQITEGHARAIASLDDKKVMLEIYKQILKENGTVRRAEELVRFYQASQGKETKGKTAAATVDEATVNAWQQSIEALLTSKPKVKLTRSRRQTRITIFLQGDEEQTQQDLDNFLNLLKSA